MIPGFTGFKGEDTRKRSYFSPVRIVKTYGDVTNAENLLSKAEFQGRISPKEPCVMRNRRGGEKAAVLVDYGAEIHGAVRFVIGRAHDAGGSENRTFRVKARFGESISEAITPVGEKNATNNHAVRDSEITLTFMSADESVETGFRFLYFELEDENTEVEVDSLTGVFIYTDLPYLGSFECDDEKLNRVWKTAAYTVHLNMQQYLWDGIKRDRIVWFGDMNTEVETALCVFGDTEVVRRSLEYGVEQTPLPGWMNNIPSYSFWWMINMCRVFMYSGDMAFVNKHREYIVGLARQITGLANNDGSINISNAARSYFIDWSTTDNEEAKYEGFIGVLGLALLCMPSLLYALGERELSEECAKKHAILRNNPPKESGHKIAAALTVVGGIRDAKSADEKYISPGGVRGYSNFMGYSVLNAKAKAENFNGALADIKAHWGAMLDLGATTFWEDFDIEWAENATRIDEFPTEGKNDIHADFGKHCYIGLRHSLCHGWAAGPCPYMSANILGVKPAVPGMSKVKIEPHLGKLSFAKGTVPTPFGVISVCHRKDRNGEVVSEISLPDGVSVAD